MIDPSNKIHPTAILSNDVTLGNNNTIGPYCVLDGNIQLGNNNIIEAHVLLSNNVTIGNKNVIGSYSLIGCKAEMKKWSDLATQKVVIGNRNVIKEHVSIHGSFYSEATQIADDCFLMNKSYLAHDCKLGREVVISSGVKLAGSVTVGSYSNLGMGACVHQRINIGESVMVGMLAAVVAHIPPFALISGVPARIKKFNTKSAISRFAKNPELVNFEKRYLEILSGNDMVDDEISSIIREFLLKHGENICKTS